MESTTEALPEPDWLRWGKELAAIAQIGLTYAGDNHFDRDRYGRIREIATEMLASNGNLGAGELLALWQSEEGYATPKVDVRAFVQNQAGEVLLVQEKSDGLWTLPGGWADVNESAASVAAREAWEEAGLHVHAVRLLAALDRSVQGHRPAFPFHVYKLFFLCSLDEPAAEPHGSDETLDARWWPLDALPPLSEGRILPRQILRLAALTADPSLPPDFD
jgi:ADP-ribose pyrophosphatase YjhB (NUDIX family)